MTVCFSTKKGFTRQTQGLSRFQLDSLPPVAGLGVALGVDASSPQVTLQALQARVKFL